MAQLSSAVSYLHTLGFVHRDIKPENIFLCDRFCRWVKLGDFGLARPQGTQVRAVWYNSPFCVPEVENAKRLSDTEEDIWMSVEPSLDCWALGVLIYCLLTGCFPWEESTSDDPLFCQFTDWLSRVEQSEDSIADLAEADVAPQFHSLSSLVLILLRKLLNPKPWLRPGPVEILSYLGGPWLRDSENKEHRKENEKQHVAKKMLESVRLQEEKEIMGRGER
ncbi:hypothetical protein DNTS_001172 [Danionella cerebrum]|uniref:Protein kinase domain-containing protein n=1 Tax=Danionella cerebrum TaxID=2873325 RepID=A0A553NJD9_9TELE|nr:hypothetical protein DNTS_001172 [Danionella translucida]